MSRILALLFFYLLVSIRLTAGEALDRFIQSGSVIPEKTAVYVYDLEARRVIESYNDGIPLIPASVMKAVTIGALLRKSGIDYRYKTCVYAQGNITDGTIEGDLLVVGSGDPSLNSTPEPHSPEFIKEIVNALKKRKVDQINGRIVIDQSVFSGASVHPSWAQGDLRHAYGTGSHGFNFENNSRGSSSVSNPSEVFVSKLVSALRAAGISVGNQVGIKSDRRILVVEHQSPTVDEIMRSCMMRSDNLFAESMLRTLSVLAGKDGSTNSGAEISAGTWRSQKIGMDGVRIVDGSGLSRENRLTARFLADVLISMSENVDYVSFFPLAGQEGTLKRFLKDTPLDSYIAMKTGSMNGIQCYAGYKLDDDYAPTHVVVVMLNGFSSRASAKDKAAKMLLEIFDNGN